MKRIHNWNREQFIAYDNSYIAEQDERGKIIAAEKRGEIKGEKKGEKKGEIKGEKRGRIKGKVEGKTEEKQGVVKRCWKKNMAVQDIAEIAGLSIEEVQVIIKSFTNEKNP